MAPKPSGKKSKGQGKKPVSDVNQRPNQTAGKRKAGKPAENPRGSKQAKSDDGSALPKKKVEAKDLNKAERQLAEELRIHHIRPSGKEVPSNRLLKTYLKPKKVIVCVSPPISVTNPNPVPVILKDVTMKFVLHSQTPSIEFRTPKYLWHIRAENFNSFDQTVESEVFNEASYPHDVDITAFINAYRIEHGGVTLTEEQAIDFVRLGQWGKYAFKDAEGDSEMAEKDKNSEPAKDGEGDSEMAEKDKNSELAKDGEGDSEMVDSQPKEKASESSTTAEKDKDSEPSKDTDGDAEMVDGQPKDKGKEKASTTTEKDKTSKPSKDDESEEDADSSSDSSSDDDPAEPISAADIRKAKEKEEKIKRKEANMYGIHCLTFRTKDTCWFDQKPSKDEDQEDIINMMDILKCGAFVTIARPNKMHHAVTENFWQNQVETAFYKGIWSYYKQELGEYNGQLFHTAYSQENPQLKHQAWMRYASLSKEAARVEKHCETTPGDFPRQLTGC